MQKQKLAGKFGQIFFVKAVQTCIFLKQPGEKMTSGPIFPGLDQGPAGLDPGPAKGLTWASPGFDPGQPRQPGQFLAKILVKQNRNKSGAEQIAEKLQFFLANFPKA